MKNKSAIPHRPNAEAISKAQYSNESLD